MDSNGRSTDAIDHMFPKSMAPKNRANCLANFALIDGRLSASGTGLAQQRWPASA